ncbi:hypothetical protein, partial [Clostridium perfringens]
APLYGPPLLLARAGSAMLVDLAAGGWRSEPMRRGMWLFPPRTGAFAADALEDEGDGHAAPWRWVVAGDADATHVRLSVACEGTPGDRTVT